MVKLILLIFFILIAFDKEVLGGIREEIDSPEVIFDNTFTSKLNLDRKFGDVTQFANNAYALGIIAIKKIKKVLCNMPKLPEPASEPWAD